MSGIRNERFSRTMRPRNPWPRGRCPILARVSRSIPVVMKRSMTPSASTMPRAAYRAPTSGRTWSTMTCRTSSTPCSSAIARIAVSNAPTTPPVVRNLPDPAHPIHGSRVPRDRPSILRAGRPEATGRMAHGPAGIIREAVEMEAAVNPEGRRILLAVDQAGVLAERRSRGDPACPRGTGCPDRPERRRAPQPAPAGRASAAGRPGARPPRVGRPGRSSAWRANAGVQATFLIWEGDPAEAILDASRAEQADTIVLGSRPRTNLRRLVLGSVSSQVARQATCDVVVVPA